MADLSQQLVPHRANRISAPLNQLARSILRRSLHRMPRALRRAAKNWQQDDEHVHELRVSSRRAHAAVNLFAPLIPASQSAWFKKQIKAILSSAGDARDLDVLIRKQLPRCGKAAKQIGRVWKVRRKKSQLPILAMHRKLNHKSQFRKHMRSLLASLKAAAPPATAEDLRITDEWIRNRLDRLSGRFFQSLSDANDVQSWHRLRSDARRLRYTLELIRPALDESLADKLKSCLTGLQDQLGTLQDHAIALKQLKKTKRIFRKSGVKKTLRKLIQAEECEIVGHSESLRLWSASDAPCDLRRHIETCLPR